MNRALQVALLSWVALSGCQREPVSAVAPGSASPAAAANARSWQRLVGILQYLEADYPSAVQSGKASELEEQAAFISEARAVAAELGRGGHFAEERLTSIEKRISAGQDPDGVSRDCGELVEDLVLAGGLARSPRHPPDLKKGAELFQTSCAACHGYHGDGQVEIAETMNPRPANFQSAKVMDGLTPYKAFNVLTFGITGTPMPSFVGLDEEERWELAYYLFTLRQGPCGHAPPKVTLEKLATATDEQLAAQYGVAEVACLRQRPPHLDEEESLLLARGQIEQAMKLSAAGDHSGARRLVLDAYLQGLEPVEPRLRSRNAGLVDELEAGFQQTRLAAERSSPHFADQGHQLLTLIDRTRRGTQAGGFWSVFWMALLILVREGFEATIVIAALLAVLAKMEHRELARVVHYGWISALVAGAVAFVFGRELLAGANREWMEGLMGLFAAGMLVYAAVWLNARSNIRKFMGELREKMKGALGNGSVAGLFVISFTSVFRESFETAIFLQGLSIDSPHGVIWGAVGGLAGLLALVLFVNRVGYRLPMKPLFAASTVLLLVTAVVLLGKGLHALQEVGALPLHPWVGLFQLDALGIYPDAVSLVPQMVLAVLPAAWMRIRR